MAKWRYFLIDEDGEVTGTNDEDLMEKYCVEGFGAVQADAGLAKWGEGDWEEVKEALHIAEEDEGEEEGEDDDS